MRSCQNYVNKLGTSSIMQQLMQMAVDEEDETKFSGATDAKGYLHRNVNGRQEDSSPIMPRYTKMQRQMCKCVNYIEYVFTFSFWKTGKRSIGICIVAVRIVKQM